jgi:hypothetical protein
VMTIDTPTRIKQAIHWIDSLLTAEQLGIKQGKSYLGDAERGYCCLGYGCAVTNTAYSPDWSSSGEFQHTVGLRGALGYNYSHIGNGSNKSCTYMNDTLDYTFLKIAETLRSSPRSYFLSEVAQGIEAHYNTEEDAL